MVMQIVHKLGQRAVKKEGEGFFLLSDKNGGFLSLGSCQNITHTQGLYHLDKNWNPYKTLENIYLDAHLTELENNFSHITRKYHGSEETFFLTSTALLYDVKNYSGFINVEVDFREMFNFDDKNRIYTIKQEGDLAIIHYLKNNNYLVIKGVGEIELMNEWAHRHYPYDAVRNAKADFHIYKALRAKCEGSIKLSIAFANTKKEAIHNAESAYNNSELLKKAIIERIEHVCKNKSLSEAAAVNSLNSLHASIGKGAHRIEGVFAGLPWFYHIWTRDELISLKAVMLQGEYAFVKKKLIQYLNSINTKGRIPNRFPKSDIDSADGIGWLFKRVYDFITILEHKKLLNKYFSKKELSDIKHKLHFSIEEHMVHYIHDYIVFNDTQETWMDTSNDGRDGACIEIQALFLAFFKLMKVLCKELNITYYGYGYLEKVFVKKVKRQFFKNGVLLDRVGDSYARPNIFIAYYIYPELLSKFEWKMVFNKAITKLWLDWGGLMSVEKSSPLFQNNYTGENDLSYHNGDSWYWINNLAAICFIDLDKQKFHYFAEYLYKASENEMLYNGLIGHCAELSSASALKSEGCLAQAWSAALFIELSQKFKS